ncbi:uncharacterized protein LOC141981431 isoform X2 [Natator depressus]|uniref:uncharacterized protein LOC141981431 isoform X2 n=1 Tax=Natator depressus TaxID=27790 RepID=UPI003EB7FE9B
MQTEPYPQKQTDRQTQPHSQKLTQADRAPPPKTHTIFSQPDHAQALARTDRAPPREAGTDGETQPATPRGAHTQPGGGKRLARGRAGGCFARPESPGAAGAASGEGGSLLPVREARKDPPPAPRGAPGPRPGVAAARPFPGPHDVPPGRDMAGPGHRSAGKPLLVKIVMAGESCVGKTSIVRRYTEPSPAGPPPAASYIATVGIDFKVKTITFNDTTVKLQIWDTAGQEQFHTISTSYFRGAHGFVLVYDITNSDSFQGITSWMKDIHEKADDEVDIVLLGNKCDKETERVIPKHSGEKDFLLLRWKELRFSLFLPSMDQLSAALLL